jgi:Ca2+-binding RTX toxin-like protein
MQSLYQRLMQDTTDARRFGSSALGSKVQSNIKSDTVVDFTDIDIVGADNIASLAYGLDQIDDPLDEEYSERGNIFSDDFDLEADGELTVDIVGPHIEGTSEIASAQSSPGADINDSFFTHHAHRADQSATIDAQDGVDLAGTGSGGTSSSALPTFSFDQIADQLTDGYWQSTNRATRSFNLDANRELTVDISALTTAGQFLATNALQAWADVTGITFTFLQGSNGGTVTEGIDAAAMVTTTASFTTGQTFQGSLSAVGDNDWVRITLQAGETYTFGLEGDGTTSQLGDPLLALYNASGSQIMQNDDGGAGLNSLITYTASSSGTYFVSAGSYNNGQSGNYLLTAQTGSVGTAAIVFDDDQSGAFSSSTTSGGAIIYSSVNVSTSWLNSYGTSLTSFNYQTYIHEIGHALGLGHAGNYNGSASYGANAHYANDSWQASVMSYFSQSENTAVNASYALAVSPQIADILAIQNLYGDASAARSGNTVYGVGETSDANVNILGTSAASIYDGGGTDTFDFSSSNSNQRIDLTPETYSDTNGRIGNLGIARGTIIENVTTGGGNDTITGNTADNILSAGAGTDTLYGGAGNDTLIGGAGNDRLIGGVGNDTYIIDNIGDLVIENPGQGIDTVLSSVSFSLRDHSQHIDHLTLTGSQNLSGIGNGQANTIQGNSGNNTLNGAGGDDTLIGGAGNDVFQFVGNFGNDTIQDFDILSVDEYIDLSSVTSISGFAGLQLSENTNGDAIISDGINSINLIGVDFRDLTTDDFLF